MTYLNYYNLFLLILISIVLPRNSIETSTSTFSRLILISFDGFRADYVNPCDTPNLYHLSQSGVSGRMRATFVTKTYPNHQSIATGLFQPYHGIVNNRFIDPRRPNESFSVDNPSPFWWDQFNRSVPIYIANQLFRPSGVQQRFSGAFQWPGSISTYTNGIDPERYSVHYLRNFNRNINWVESVDYVIDEWILNPSKPANLVFLYFPEPDSTSHSYGPFSDEVRAKVKLIDKAIGYLIERLKEEQLYSSTDMIILSDHGMAEISPKRVIYLEKCSRKNLKYKMIGVSPVYSLIPESGTPEFVRDALNNCSESQFESKFKVYLQEEIPEEFHYRGNDRILPLFLLADDGYDVRFSSSEKQRIPKGNHGFNQSLPSMRPLFIASGPKFKPSYSHAQVFSNVDLYPLMLHLLNIPIEQFPSNGSFEKVSQMLINNPQKPQKNYFSYNNKHEQNIIPELFLLLGIALSLLLFGMFGAYLVRAAYQRRVRMLVLKDNVTVGKNNKF